MEDTSGALPLFTKITEQLESQLPSPTSGETPEAKTQSAATKAAFSELARGFQQVPRDLAAAQDEEVLPRP